MAIPASNSVYWKQRFEQIEAAANKSAVETFETVQKQYLAAEREIEQQISTWYQRFAKNNQISMAEARKLLTTKELAEFKWDVKEFIKYGEENELNQQWMKELENASARFHVSRLEALKVQTQQTVEKLFGNQTDSIDRLLKKNYLEGYYHTAYEVHKGFNIGWDIAAVDDNTVERLISKPWATDGKNFSDRIWSNKTNLINEVQTQLTRTFMLGRSPDEAIKAIADKMKTSKNQAGRLVMTESAFFSSQSQGDAFNQLDVELYEIVATLDSRTSEICQELDGQVFDMKDFQPGVTAPPFHVWCRTTTVPHFDDNYTERAARGADGKTYYVPGDMKYPDWKKSFVDGGSKEELKEVLPGQTVMKAKTFKEKIQDVKDTITAKGGKIEEADIQNAGKAVQEELQVKRMPMKAEIDALEKQYKETGIEEVESQLSKLKQARRGLVDLDEVGLKDMDSLSVKYDELMQKKFQLNPITSELETKLKEAKAKYSGKLKDNAGELKEKIAEIRNMGNGSFNVDAHLNNSRSPMRKVVKEAYDYYPNEWVDKSITKSTLSPKKVDRGFYSDARKEIAISGWSENGYLETAIHELGHRFERAVPGIRDAEKLFYERRTAGDTLKWLGGRYDYSEKSRFDKFLNPYMGKDYGGSAYELVSMGFEYAYTNPTKLWEDEDFATWIYGILSLY